MVCFFLAVFLAQLVFWAFAFFRAYTPVMVGPMLSDTGVRASVIVCFRNEEANLENCIDRILAQSFPGEFELILVDDNSTDNSLSVVHPFVIRYDNVRLLDPGATRPGKKDALAYGIAHARYEHLLLTDADCVPASSHWLWSMTEPLRLGQELVLGVSPLFPGKRSGLLAYWQWFESVYVSLKYLGFAYRYRPYMGVGRNLAYTKGFYERSGGFAAHADLPSGDDDLLVSVNADPKLTARVVNPAAWTHSVGQPTWRNYFRQRSRHQSTGVHYPTSTAWWLGAVAFSHGMFYLLGCYLLFTEYWWFALCCYALRWVCLLLAYFRPLLQFDPARYGGFSADAGATEGWKSWVWLAGTITWGDLLVGPMYLYLAVSSFLPKRGW